MFEKYNINDLFLASINVTYPEIYSENFGDIFKSGIAGYGYLTILRKVGPKYVDLQNMSRDITNHINPKTTSYTINYMEPLSKYYTQDGKKKDIFCKRQAIKIAKQYYDAIHQNHLKELEEKQESQKVRI